MSEAEDITVGGYELRNCVASGATTQIWEVNEPGSATPLAMKLILDEFRKKSAHRNVLKHEYKVGSMMKHPQFLRFHTIEINRDHSFFLMDFFPSPNLKTHLISNLAAVQSSFVKLADSLTQAYEFMHETGWLHRDIKPENILVNKSGDARVIDFSLSSKVKSPLALKMARKAKSIQGTRTYIAPETILRKPSTPQTDIYNLGVTLFEVLTGAPPFAGDSPNALLRKHIGEAPTEPSAYNSNVTKEMDRVILRALEKDPTKRYESMQELGRAIQETACFEVDPLELKRREAAEAKEKQAQSVDKRLNSRADAERTAKGLPAPAVRKKKKKVDPRVLEEEERRLAAEKAKQQPAAPEYPPQQQPFPAGMPGQPIPPMGYPGMPMPPGMPMQQPGMPMQQPGMPMPAAGYPGMPIPPQHGMPQPHQMPQQQPVMPQQPQMPHAPAQPHAPPPPAAVPQNPAQPPQAPIPPQPAPPSSQEEPEEATLDDMAGFDIE